MPHKERGVEKPKSLSFHGPLSFDAARQLVDMAFKEDLFVGITKGDSIGDGGKVVSSVRPKQFRTDERSEKLEELTRDLMDPCTETVIVKDLTTESPQPHQGFSGIRWPVT